MNKLVCNLLAPARPGMSFLEPLQQALAGAGSRFNCSSQLASFNAAQSGADRSGRHDAADTADPGSGRSQSHQFIGCPGPDQPGLRDPGRTLVPGQCIRVNRGIYQFVPRRRAMKFLRHFPPSAWKFAVFAVVCLVLLVALAVRIGNVSLFSSRHGISAEMNDVTGLTTGDGVDIAGVQVGQVSSITLQRGHALVGLDLNNNVTLRQGTDVGLRWHNVIGQKEVYLFPGRDGPTLKPGATLPLTHDVSDASVNAFLKFVRPVSLGHQSETGQ